MKTHIFLLLFLGLSQNLLAQKEEDLSEYMVQLQENNYVHFNKTYYFRGENVFFSAHMLYGNQAYRDSLSKVLYVDFLNTEGKTLVKYRYPIKNSIAIGSFKITDSLAIGTYYARFYTNWMRNYGDSTIQYYPIQVVADGVLPLSNVPVSKYCDYIEPLKKAYTPSDSITFSFRIPDLQSYSVSVTDTFSVKRIALPYQSKIYTEFTNKIYHVHFPIERSLSLNGRLIAGKKALKNKSLTAMTQISHEPITIQTDSEGRFSHRYDSFDDDKLLFGETDEKKVLQFLSDTNRISSKPLPSLNINYTPNDRGELFEKDTTDKTAIKLNEVSITARKIEEEKPRINNTYGRADFVVKGSDIQYSQVDNPLYALQGKVPGVRISTINGKIQVDIRGSQSSSFEKIEQPLYLVNGVPVDNLAIIPLFRIERIEVVKRIVPIMGSRSANGIINVITKDGNTAATQAVESRVITANLPAYSTSSSFKANNQCLLWATDTVANTESITHCFKTKPYAAVYRIEIIGVLRNGNLVKCNRFMTVD